MQRVLQSLFFITGIVFLGVGQVWLWELPKEDRLVPYLLTSIVMILVAIYLQGLNK